MKKTKETNKSTVVKLPTYVVDKGALTEQLLTDDASNWIIEKGSNMILNGETPGKNMILLLEHLNIIKSK